MIRAEYDSQADALSIDLVEATHWDDAIWIDDDYCHISLEHGVPANIELLSPADNLRFLRPAGEAAGVEPELLEAAARSALAAPDRTVSLDFSAIH